MILFHFEDIFHRDIKPENLIYTNYDYTLLKLSDFGFAENFIKKSLILVRCGTPGFNFNIFSFFLIFLNYYFFKKLINKFRYFAPEILRKEHYD